MREASEMSNLHEQKLQEYVEESEIRHRMEMFEIEERKKDQLSKIIASHQQAFKELRNYYNDITLNNLALISTIKEQMEELRDKSEKTEKNMAMVCTKQIQIVIKLALMVITLGYIRKSSIDSANEGSSKRAEGTTQKT